MEKVCNICGNEKDDGEEYTEKNVLIICENCLRENNFPSILEQFLL